jgi:hypothetical protein
MYIVYKRGEKSLRKSKKKNSFGMCRSTALSLNTVTTGREK